MDNQALIQAVIRAGRTIAAAAISAAALAVPQALGVFNLDPTSFAFATMVLTGVLNGVGKYIRGESVPADGGPVTARDRLPI